MVRQIYWSCMGDWGALAAIKMIEWQKQDIRQYYKHDKQGT